MESWLDENGDLTPEGRLAFDRQAQEFARLDFDSIVDVIYEMRAVGGDHALDQLLKNVEAIGRLHHDGCPVYFRIRQVIKTAVGTVRLTH